MREKSVCCLFKMLHRILKINNFLLTYNQEKCGILMLYKVCWLNAKYQNQSSQPQSADSCTLLNEVGQLNVTVQIVNSDYIADTIIFITLPNSCSSVLTASLCS